MAADHTHTGEPTERSLGSLLRDLTTETSTLVRNEVNLAKAEISEKISQVTNSLIALVVGAIIAFAGVLKLLDAAVFGIATLLDPVTGGELWLAALIVGAVVAIIGYAMISRGRKNLRPESLAPHRTVDQLRRDQEFAKEQVNERT